MTETNSVTSSVTSVAKSVAGTVTSTASAVTESVTTYVQKGFALVEERLPEVSYPSSLPTPAEVVDRSSALVTSLVAKLPFVDDDTSEQPGTAAEATKSTKATKTTKKSAA
jgi:hypothetical protein